MRFGPGCKNFFFKSVIPGVFRRIIWGIKAGEW